MAFGAFLAGRGVLDPWLVFGVTWTANVTSAALVYVLGRHYGRAFFTGRLGRRLVSEATMSHIEAAYAKHGSYGIFVSRLLPVWRAVVPPFAGVTGVPAARAVVPVALASALWYGGITLLVFRLAPTLDETLRVLGGVNRILAVGALVLVVLAIVWLRRRLRAP